MELKQLQFLVACAQTQSFSKAASQLFTTQSNVSKVIKSLEEELSVDLFDRKQYGIKLTEQGKKVYEYALATLDSASKILEYTKEKVREELRIACIPGQWMAKVFCAYYKTYGRVDVSYHVMTAGTNEIIQRLSADLDHLGFVCIMEDQLEMLQGTLTKNHISFSVLKKTEASLAFGNQGAAEAYRKAEEEQKPFLLVQGYEDEFSLKAFHDEPTEKKEHLVKHRVAVTTNSEFVMKELLEHTSLGNIGYGALSNLDIASVKTQPSSESAVKYMLFGCLFRNDRNLGSIQKQYLNFVKEQLTKQQ